MRDIEKIVARYEKDRLMLSQKQDAQFYLDMIEYRRTHCNFRLSTRRWLLRRWHRAHCRLLDLWGYLTGKPVVWYL